VNDIAIINQDMVVGLAFTLRDDEGALIDEASSEDPLLYLHGHGNIVPGLEGALQGKTLGAQLSVVVAPEQAYGPRQGPGPQVVPRDAFPADAELEPGMPFAVEDDDGNELQLFVIGVEDGEVLIDANHPLAGVTLNFEVEVVSVRAATQDELEHGHPHT